MKSVLRNLLSGRKMQTILFVLSFCFIAQTESISVFSQSINPDFPTGISSNQITGSIKSRDLGDARLTSYYYTFNGDQGDIFINVAATNFVGDIDFYVVEGLRPLTKISFYGDNSQVETGRVIYLRKPEKIIVRVQGRTPDDNPATYQLKFAGSFVAVADTSDRQPDIPVVKSEETSGIRVNSVGTLIKTEDKNKKVEEGIDKVEIVGEKTDTTEKISDDQPKVVVTDNLEKQSDEKSTTAEVEKNEVKKAETPSSAVNRRRRAAPRNSRRNTARTTTVPPKAKTSADETAKKSAETTAKTDPLENVRLTVLMKDGEKLEFPMTEVFRFSMNNGVLTVITKDGKIHRKPITEVQKMSVE